MSKNTKPAAATKSANVATIEPKEADRVVVAETNGRGKRARTKKTRVRYESRTMTNIARQIAALEAEEKRLAESKGSADPNAVREQIAKQANTVTKYEAKLAKAHKRLEEMRERLADIEAGVGGDRNAKKLAETRAALAVMRSSRDALVAALGDDALKIKQ